MDKRKKKTENLQFYDPSLIIRVARGKSDQLLDSGSLYMDSFVLLMHSKAVKAIIKEDNLQFYDPSLTH